MSAITRREILWRASCLSAVGAAPFALNLLPFNALAASTTGYRALVCVFLFGGMDCHDTLIPFDQTSYNANAQIRQSLFAQYANIQGGSTRARDRLLALSPTNASALGGREFALPEALAPLRDLFALGDAAVVANVGPLLEPTTRTQFRARSVSTPARLFSHNDQQSTWMASAPEGARLGWGGRLGDMAIASSANSRTAFTAISASGNAIWLTGEQALQFQVGSNGPQQINAINRTRLYNSARAPVLLSDQIQDVGDLRTNIFERDVASIYRASIANNRDLQVAISAQAPFSTVFPTNNSLASQLNIVARIIAARGALGVNRQVFFVSMGGFDTHSGQAPSLASLHQRLSSALRAFYDTTVELGVANDVAAFTASDFGRTLTVNGDGTDHGWGAHHFVVGGALNGGRILGSPPPAAVNHEQDSGNGRLIPVLAVEQYAASLARWFGLTDNEIRDALPGIVNFDINALDLFPASPQS